MSNEKPYVSYFRPAIDAMLGYTPGEQPKGTDVLKLNTNESPYPPAPGVRKMLADFDYERLRLYPDPMATEVRSEIAALFGLTYENVIAGNGSDDILNIAIRCFCDAERPVAFLDPSYSLYPTLAKLQGAEFIRIPLTENFDIPENVLDLAQKGNLFFIARPNAPTGNLLSKDAMHHICRNFKGIVVIDEAYADFSEDNCMDFVKLYSNVIITRTFSKSRSLAGLRFSFAVAHPKIMDGMMKMKDSYNVSMLT
ncbi:MAG: aminotransferase class I/II-fold pyridoxal phosphate-dependent enzyme, partial [Lentisphaeria bacterium]|nr:aminotransferase class I/II-fold pyridoxal phosphate-dependent enzyme [Lentisphaeria bacterium]